MDRPDQLLLPIELVREPTLATYRPGPNAEACAAVAALAQGTGESFLYLFGAATTGKTHLLHAACHAVIARGRRAQLLPLAQAGLTPAILDALEQRDLLAIDDLHCIAGNRDWELGLFNLFNRARARDCALLIAANAGPDELGIELADLRSRLHWGPRYCLLPLGDADCEALLTEVAAGLGMRLGPETARYIMNHHARDPASLVTLIQAVDRLSLREQRPPSIPLVRRIIHGEV
ncbi:MAG: DnaA regulatory inactivator Hda [Sphingobacteriia bacterium]|nr:DnaA regulatory inactivator Hda [Sphingobacteriia bacterium]NCC37958.1 DnaA regulatory inactivator Hda [Gammaproteobacteria bacterium]